jgi:integrase
VNSRSRFSTPYCSNSISRPPAGVVAHSPSDSRAPTLTAVWSSSGTKGSTVGWQPITPTLTNCLADHANARGTILPTDQLLRFRNGHPLTSRRYDHLWKRLADRLPWLATQGISTHWLRHTTLTWIERHLGYAVARAGHTDNTGPVTTTSIKANLQ